MIRVYRGKEDKVSILNLIKSMGIEEEVGSLDDIVLNSMQFLLYEQNGIEGFSYSSVYANSAGESIAQISVYVEPDSRLKGIGSTLYKAMEEVISKTKPDFVCTYMRVESENPIGFAKKMGFEKWWGSLESVYKGGTFPKADIELIKYEDRFFDQFVKMVQECYYELHEKNDIKPYLAPEDGVKKYKLNNKNNVYLVLENEQIVASVTTGEGILDNLMVVPSYQGNGYGRKALQFGMNEMLEEGYEEIRICFLEGNESAERLYTSLGFKPLHNTQVYRKFL
ncbi:MULTISPECIES: GNAT family N-acetyltransferase [Bacillus]|uniref:GNAT family N-acetyltransferase n=1 Tax=Bacillus pseudomycoides TaxID=64104 RepID=A0AAJ2DN46_9BACI|nr:MULTISPECIES: GNAT family N-acetyltransferase [Bacillus]KFN12781.1 acetyltransferase domain protein [Bacillus pseudomycoides]MDR4190180.1 GNAT family N-acetyltransferase [Bacillus pseudomycoides]MDR4327028.1 GNAT family N-acetyltransferase [Bacillus pseudomycoides]MED0855548.1 GNAT family N-acetyltransferase [Bacillus pseudomycoides]MED1538905.1 GNAT family N-acetyltransferase [Bacillus pseudomycoides]